MNKQQSILKLVFVISLVFVNKIFLENVFLDERFPNGLSLTISDAAQLIMLEKPKEIADQYLKFMNSLPTN